MPPDVRALLLTITCFGSAGFKHVKSLQARLLVAPPPPVAAAPAAADGAAQEDGTEDDAAPPPRTAHKRQPEQ